MRNTRKGFTLVEMLIVITIMGTLAAVMMAASGDLTAKAKAQSIAANINTFRIAASEFYADHFEDDKVKVKTGASGTEEEVNMSATTAAAFLGNYSTGYEYVLNFSDYSSGSITYTVGTGAGRDNWNVVVSFANDAEATNIQKQLEKIKGYSTVATGKTGFTVNLKTGAISDLTGGA